MAPATRVAKPGMVPRPQQFGPIDVAVHGKSINVGRLNDTTRQRRWPQCLLRQPFRFTPVPPLRRRYRNRWRSITPTSEWLSRCSTAAGVAAITPMVLLAAGVAAITPMVLLAAGVAAITPMLQLPAGVAAITPMLQRRVTLLPAIAFGAATTATDGSDYWVSDRICASDRDDASGYPSWLCR